MGKPERGSRPHPAHRFSTRLTTPKIALFCALSVLSVLLAVTCEASGETTWSHFVYPSCRKCNKTGRVKSSWLWGKNKCSTCNGTTDWNPQIVAAIEEGCEQYSAYGCIPTLIYGFLGLVHISNEGRSACNLHTGARTVRAAQWCSPNGLASCAVRVDSLGKGLYIGTLTSEYTDWKNVMARHREARYYASVNRPGAENGGIVSRAADMYSLAGALLGSPEDGQFMPDPVNRTQTRLPALVPGDVVRVALREYPPSSGKHRVEFSIDGYDWLLRIGLIENSPLKPKLYDIALGVTLGAGAKVTLLP